MIGKLEDVAYTSNCSKAKINAKHSFSTVE